MIGHFPGKFRGFFRIAGEEISLPAETLDAEHVGVSYKGLWQMEPLIGIQKSIQGITREIELFQRR